MKQRQKGLATLLW